MPHISLTVFLCCRIQAWWRMIKQRLSGVIQALRRQIRLHHKLRQKHTTEIRKTIIYCVKDSMGLASHLSTDTREETVLKRIPIFRRHQARKFILLNQSDIEFYRICCDISDVQRKGLPKRGFELGTLEELTDQALYGGFRLPGGILLKLNSTVHRTYTDLSCLPSEVMSVGCLVRIKKEIFQVKNIRENSIEFDRQWKGTRTRTGASAYTDADTYTLDPEIEIEIDIEVATEAMGAIDTTPHPSIENVDKYEIMYRLPSRPSETQQRYFNLKYQMSHYILDSKAVRICGDVQKQSYSVAAACCSRIARFYFSIKMDKTVHSSRGPAVYCVTDTDWVEIS